ncbi:MAG: hypothetical protein ACRD0P_31590, partial [Stackebrandtia sp.]
MATVQETIGRRTVTFDGLRAHVTTAVTADDTPNPFTPGSGNQLSLTLPHPVGPVPVTVATGPAERATVMFVRAESAITLAVRPISSVCGRSMTFAAAVTGVPPGSGTPTGTVTFTADDGPATPVTLADGVATFTTQL